MTAHRRILRSCGHWCVTTHDGSCIQYTARERLKDAALLPTVDSVIARAHSVGIAKISVNATHEGDWEAVLDLHRRFPDVVIPSIGVHPWWAAGVTPGWEDRLRDALLANPHAQLGEIGLDKLQAKRPESKHHALLDVQLAVFRSQLVIAAECGGRVASVHGVAAYNEVLEVVRDFPGVPVLLHAYAGNATQTQALARTPNCTFSICGTVEQAKVAKILKHIPLLRLVVETDSPCLTPLTLLPPDASTVNEPSNVVVVLAEVAKQLGKSVEEVREACYANACTLFGCGDESGK